MRMCALVCVHVRAGGRALFVYVWVCVGGEVMRPWRVPCSPEKGFLKKRGMPARCTSVGVMLGVLLRLARVLLLHHHLLAQVHFPTYLALPSLPLGLARPVISRAT